MPPRFVLKKKRAQQTMDSAAAASPTGLGEAVAADDQSPDSMHPDIAAASASRAEKRPPPSATSSLSSVGINRSLSGGRYDKRHQGTQLLRTLASEERERTRVARSDEARSLERVQRIQAELQALQLEQAALVGQAAQSNEVCRLPAELDRDLLRVLPQTIQSIRKGGPPPLVDPRQSVDGRRANSHYPNGRDLRRMSVVSMPPSDTATAAHGHDKGDAQQQKRRCLWVTPDGRIFLESWSQYFTVVEEFLVAIAEPEARPVNIYEFQMTEHSLYAAVSMGYRTHEIIAQLQSWSKVELPESLVGWIEEKTRRCGKVKLVLREDGHHIETMDAEIMRQLLADFAVRDCMAKPSGLHLGTAMGGAADMDMDPARSVEGKGLNSCSSTAEMVPSMVQHFVVAAGRYRDIKRACSDLGYPIIEEYDFKNDKRQLPGTTHVNGRLNQSRTGLALKSVDNVRSYQARCLNNLFGSNGCARSGIIVLPCGAGKSFVGVTAACTINKKTFVVCPTSLSVDQWKFQFEKWTNAQAAGVRIEGITSSSLQKSDALEVIELMKADVIITTYNALTAGREDRRTVPRQMMLRELEHEYEFGLMILDEVHMLPAATFQKSLDKIKAYCKLGLTATLVREDGKIDDLRFLIGPKIFEANWMELQKEGYLAKVQCHEVQCPMAGDFFAAYLAATAARQRGGGGERSGGSQFHKEQMLYIMNPNKMLTTHYLLRKHKQLGHKIIVFSDRIFPLQVLSAALTSLDQQLPIGHPDRFDAGRIDGSCEAWERERLMQSFKNNPNDNIILLSKVGDAALDMPDANVIIQIASNGGARMQEAQRLGRILRPKSGVSQDAYFYSLVSQDTYEMRFSTARQRYLVQQGYAFHVHPPNEKGVFGEAQRTSEALVREGKPPLLFSTRDEQRVLLAQIEEADKRGSNLGEDLDREGKLRSADAELGALSGKGRR